MPKNGYFTARIDQSLMEEVDAILAQLGLSKSEALTLFYTQVKVTRGLPFPVRLPNAETRKIFEETDQGKGLHHAENLNDLFRQLEM